MNSRLGSIRLIRGINKDNNTELRLPNPMLFSNIPLLWNIISMVVQDWERESTPFQETINKSTSEGERLFHVLQSFMKLQPYFLKCLFSYTLFFVSLENAYDLLYAELNALNRRLGIRVKHEKRPKPSQYIKKVKRIRDLSIAHMGSHKKASEVNVFSAMLWQPLTWITDSSGPWHVNEITFGNGEIISRDSQGNLLGKSDDHKIQGISEMNIYCMEYINEYDRICAEYFNNIKGKLPITVDGILYVDLKNSPTAVSNP